MTPAITLSIVLQPNVCVCLWTPATLPQGDRVVSQLQGALGAGPPLQDSAQTRLVAGSLPLAQSSTSFMDGKLSSEIWHNKTGSSEGSSSSSLAIGDAGGVQLDSDDLAPNSSKHMHGQQQQQVAP
jgi:hypothetical protein